MEKKHLKINLFLVDIMGGCGSDLLTTKMGQKEVENKITPLVFVDRAPQNFISIYDDH